MAVFQQVSRTYELFSLNMPFQRSGTFIEKEITTMTPSDLPILDSRVVRALGSRGEVTQFEQKYSQSEKAILGATLRTQVFVGVTLGFPKAMPGLMT